MRNCVTGHCAGTDRAYRKGEVPHGCAGRPTRLLKSAGVLRCKKAGLILDYKLFVSNRRGPNDCDLNFAELYPSAAAAFDYSAADDAKMDEIGKAHWGQWSEDEAKKLRDSRFAMRRFISNTDVRELILKPIK